MTVSATLGSRRLRVARQLLTESLLLCLAGGSMIELLQRSWELARFEIQSRPKMGALTEVGALANAWSKAHALSFDSLRVIFPS